MRTLIVNEDDRRAGVGPTAPGGKLENANEPPAFESETIEQTFAQLLMVVELCVKARATTPALVLIYSAIDVAGWLYAVSPSATPKSRFIGWVTKFLLPAAKLDCSAIELYGARCGVVHNFSSESDLSRQSSGKVRQIVYSWGNSDLETLREMSRIVNLDLGESPKAARGQPRKFTSVKLEDLIAAFGAGLMRFFKESESDQRMAARIRERSGKVLMQMSNAKANAIVNWSRALLGENKTGCDE